RNWPETARRREPTRLSPAIGCAEPSSYGSARLRYSSRGSACSPSPQEEGSGEGIDVPKLHGKYNPTCSSEYSLRLSHMISSRSVITSSRRRTLRGGTEPKRNQSL